MLPERRSSFVLAFLSKKANTTTQAATLTGYEFSHAAHNVDCALQHIGDEVDNAREKAHDGRDDGVDHRGEGADERRKELVDGLEKVFKGGDEFGHSDLRLFMFVFGLELVDVIR